MKSLGDSYRALVIGATGAIGSAFVTALQADEACIKLVALSRTSQPGFTLEDEDSMRQAAGIIALDGPFQLIIDATGALTIDGQGPEKSLAALSAGALMRNFQVNAIGPALLMKHFMGSLDDSRRAIYAKLSARVGSISDNRKGGWYGYRAAKAAMNMMLQSAAIESARRKQNAVFAAVQPGTVMSSLTAPFVGPEQCISPQTSVQGMLRALDGLAAQPFAQFIDYRGNAIPW